MKHSARHYQDLADWTDRQGIHLGLHVDTRGCAVSLEQPAIVAAYGMILPGKAWLTGWHPWPAGLDDAALEGLGMVGREA